jgi:hypothetical protein
MSTLAEDAINWSESTLSPARSPLPKNMTTPSPEADASGSVSAVRGMSERRFGATFRSSTSPEREGRERDPMYVTKWCKDHAGIGFQFTETKSTVTYAGASLGPKACRATNPIPNFGQWYLEVTPHCEPTKPERSPLGGNTFVGICASKFQFWDGAWWEGDNRQENEPYVFGLWDRGTLTKPSHDRQRDWLENSRFRSGDTIGMMCDMDKRTLALYRNGEVMQDPGGHYQDGIVLNIGSQELFPDGFWPVVVLADRFHRAKLSFRPIWVQILQSTLPEHAFPISPTHARIGSPNGRHLDDDADDAFVKKMMGLNAADSKEPKKAFKFGRRGESPARSASPGSPADTRPQSPECDPSSRHVAEVLTIFTPLPNTSIMSQGGAADGGDRSSENKVMSSPLGMHLPTPGSTVCMYLRTSDMRWRYSPISARLLQDVWRV